MRAVLALLVAAHLGVPAALAQPTGRAAAPGPAMAEAAQAFLATLGPDERATATFDFADEERYNWHFTPRTRRGLPLKQMSLEQRRAAHALLRSALSNKGYLKATHVIYLERILFVLENEAPRRDPELYFLSVFGEPGADAPWGWRIEGHHLSLNLSVVADGVSVTPSFFGSNPAEVRSGPYAGLRVLGAEEDLARALARSLDAGQRATGILDAEVPAEIITGVERAAILDAMEGVPAAAMNPLQRDLLMGILREYAETYRPTIAQSELEAIEQAGIDNLHFLWIGSLDVGEPHYYRIHGPTVLFEYDNTQNDANHIHTVWRDFAGDWGDDLLQQHYEAAPSGHGH